MIWRLALAVVAITSAAWGGDIKIFDPDGVKLPHADEFLWQTYVKADRECAGVIVAQNWVLTAAHCVASSGVRESVSYPPDNKKVMKLKRKIFVYAGIKKFNEPGVNKFATCVRPVYPDNFVGGSPKHHDIALIFVPLPLLAGKRETIEFATVADEKFGSKAKAFVAGFVCPAPASLANSKAHSKCHNQMNYAKMIIPSQSNCDEMRICAGADSPDTPHFDEHDSGAGLVTARKGASARLLGVANYTGSPNEYARISQHADWIRKVIAARVTFSPEHGPNCNLNW